jgi:hypothetical protein
MVLLKKRPVNILSWKQDLKKLATWLAGIDIELVVMERLKFTGKAFTKH